MLVDRLLKKYCSTQAVRAKTANVTQHQTSIYCANMLASVQRLRADLLFKTTRTTWCTSEHKQDSSRGAETYRYAGRLADLTHQADRLALEGVYANSSTRAWFVLTQQTRQQSHRGMMCVWAA